MQSDTSFDKKKKQSNSQKNTTQFSPGTKVTQQCDYNTKQGGYAKLLNLPVCGIF